MSKKVEYVQLKQKITHYSSGFYIIVGLFFIVLFWLVSDDTFETKIVETSLSSAKVSVVEVQPDDKTFAITVMGNSQVRWQTDVVAGVSGRVKHIADHTLPGNWLNLGDSLVTIVDSYYIAEQKSALARVAQAELSYAKVKNEQLVAKKVANAKSLTAFGQHIPHVKSAKADLIAAQALYKNAVVQLDETHIKAPFDIIILDRQVTPGQWVNAGDKLFSIAARDSIDITVMISALSWQQLGNLHEKTLIKILTQNKKEWTATLYYISPIMDPVTRQHSVTLVVNDPYTMTEPLLSGQQVEVVFQGLRHMNVVKAPASSLTEDGKVWSVENGILIQEEVEVLEEKPKYVFFRYLNKPKEKRTLVIYPLSSMMVDQNVTTEQVQVFQ